MIPPYPSLTAEWHNDTYDAISPSNPAVSAKERTVVITGAGAGIGREIAKAYAEAGAAHVAVLGRTQKTLDETKSIINQQSPDTQVTTHIADVADEEAVQKAATELKGWDVLILNAGVTARPTPIAEAKLADWWRVFETNVKGAIICAQCFLPTRSASPSTSIIGINTGQIQLPADVDAIAGNSAYSSSKIAQAKVMEFLAAENPDVFVASVHPGVVETDILKRTAEEGEQKGNAEAGWAMDDVKLPAHFLLWMTSPEARFLRGKFAWANWDVVQLKMRAKEIEESQMLTSNVLGWPYSFE